MYNSISLINIWGQYVELKCGKEASILEFLHLINVENLLATLSV